MKNLFPSMLRYWDGSKFVPCKAYIFNGDEYELVDINYRTKDEEFVRINDVKTKED